MLATGYCVANVFLERGMDMCLLILERKPMTDLRWIIKLLLRLLTICWVHTHKAQRWLKSSYTTQNLTPTWQKSHISFKTGVCGQPAGTWAVQESLFCNWAGQRLRPSEAPPPAVVDTFWNCARRANNWILSLCSVRHVKCCLLPGFHGLSFRKEGML